MPQRTPQDLMGLPLHIGSFISTLATVQLPRGIADTRDATASSLKVGEYISLHVRKVISPRVLAYGHAERLPAACVAMRAGSSIVALCSSVGTVIVV